MGVWVRPRTTTAGKRRYAVVYRRGGRYTPTEQAGTFRTRREADLRAQRVREWLAMALDPRVELARARTEGLTVSEVARQWLEGKRRVTDTTRGLYGQVVERIVVDLGRVPVEALSPVDVSDWVGALERQYRPGTVRKYVDVLRQALDTTGQPNVARDRRVEMPRTERRILRPPDADATLAALARLQPRHLQVCVLIEQCGLRVSEACHVEAGHLDREGRRLLVAVSKTGPRWVPVPVWLLERLEPPWPVTRQTVHNALKTACADAGVAAFGPHMLRHRRASLWHLQGVPPVQAAAWLGHSPREHLATYTHVMPVGEVGGHRLAALLAVRSNR